MRVFGFATGYAKEEGIDSGSRFFLMDYVHRARPLNHVDKGVFLLFCGVVLGGLTLWCWRFATTEVQAPTWHERVQAPAAVRGATMLAFALMLLFSPHYAWYNLWLVPFMVLAPSLPLLVYVLGFFYGYTTGLADPGPKMFLLNERLYLAVAIAFALHFVLKRWPIWPKLISRDRVGEDAVLAEVREDRAAVTAHG